MVKLGCAVGQSSWADSFSVLSGETGRRASLRDWHPVEPGRGGHDMKRPNKAALEAHVDNCKADGTGPVLPQPVQPLRHSPGTVLEDSR